MQNVLLISEKYLKENSVINNNVDSCYLLPAIQTAQEIALQQLIGTKLYNRICSMVSDGTINSNEQYKTLLDNYIIPYLQQVVLREIQIPLFGKLRNAGVLQSTDQQTQILTIKDVEYIKEYYNAQSVFYGDRLTKYLLANNHIFTDFLTCDDCSQLHGKVGGNTNSGIYLGL